MAIRIAHILLVLIAGLGVQLNAVDNGKSPVKFFVSAEFGFTGFLQNDIAFGRNNPEFSYVRQGAQDVLFSNWRGQAGIEFLEDHSFTLLYQPIYPSSQTVAQQNMNFGAAKFSRNYSAAI